VNRGQPAFVAAQASRDVVAREGSLSPPADGGADRYSLIRRAAPCADLDVLSFGPSIEDRQRVKAMSG
jgi:hypothetical protein